MMSELTSRLFGEDVRLHEPGKVGLAGDADGAAGEVGRVAPLDGVLGQLGRLDDGRLVVHDQPARPRPNDLPAMVLYLKRFLLISECPFCKDTIVIVIYTSQNTF